MDPILLVNSPQSGTGLTTYLFTAPLSTIYYADVQLTEIPPSGLVVTVKQNGTTVYTTPTLAPTQIAQQFKTPLNCTAGDTITVALTSGSAIDSTLNAVKYTLSVGQGLGV
jgi:hypothetical protein